MRKQVRQGRNMTGSASAVRRRQRWKLCRAVADTSLVLFYKALDPWDIKPGDRVYYLGRARTVLSSCPAFDEPGYYIGFADGLSSLFVETLSVVDEDRVTEFMARYSMPEQSKRRAG
jgi:hypothetical protein